MAEPVILPSALGTSVGDCLVSWGNLQFGVWVDQNLHCWVAKHTRGATDWTKYDLGNIPGNPLSLPLDDADGHMSPSIGVDSEGRVYVAANNFVQVDTPRVVKSGTGGNITSWVNEYPNLPVPAEPQGIGTYPVFFQFRDGGLLYKRSHRTQIVAATPWDCNNGSRAYFHYKPPGTNQAWQRNTPTTRGEDNTQNAFYWCGLWLDANERLHGFGLWDLAMGDTQLDCGFGGNLNIWDHSYVYSDDRGVTWHAIDGTPMTTPMTRTNMTAAHTGISFGDFMPNEETNHFYISSTTVDGNGYPWSILNCRLANPPWQPGHYIVKWDGNGWITDAQIRGQYGTGEYLFHWRGAVWIAAQKHESAGTLSRRIEVKRLSATPKSVAYVGHRTIIQWQCKPDLVALRDHNTVEFFMPDENNNPIVYTFGTPIKAG